MLLLFLLVVALNWCEASCWVLVLSCRSLGCHLWFSNYLAEEQKDVALSLLRVPWVGLQSVIVAIPSHTRLFFDNVKINLEHHLRKLVRLIPLMISQCPLVPERKTFEYFSLLNTAWKTY